MVRGHLCLQYEPGDITRTFGAPSDRSSAGDTGVSALRPQLRNLAGMALIELSGIVNSGAASRLRAPAPGSSLRAVAGRLRS